MSVPERQGGRRWRTLRAQVLREEPVCAIRGPRHTGSSTTVDHVVPGALGGAEFDRGNCRGACGPCNYGRSVPARPPVVVVACSRCGSRVRHPSGLCHRDWWTDKDPAGRMR
jgi:5-methylcytosine-specific restriction endonuclease McrA